MISVFIDLEFSWEQLVFCLPLSLTSHSKTPLLASISCSFTSYLLPSSVLFIPFLYRSSSSLQLFSLCFSVISKPCLCLFSSFSLAILSPLPFSLFSFACCPPLLFLFPPYFCLCNLPPTPFILLSSFSYHLPPFPLFFSHHRRRWTPGQRCLLCSVAWPTTPT